MENQDPNQTQDTQAENIPVLQDELNFESIPKLIKLIDSAMRGECAREVVGPKRFSGVNFEGVTAKFQPPVVEVIDQLFSPNPKGIFLTGDVGTGKTSILRVIWRYLVSGLAIQEYRNIIAKTHQSGYGQTPEYQFLTNWDLVRNLRKDVEEQEDDWSGSKSVKYLFVDDLGRSFEDKSGWNQALQDEFFDYRWQECLPTFISTNKTAEELRAWEGWSRIVDRLCDPSWMVMLKMGEGSRRKV